MWRRSGGGVRVRRKSRSLLPLGLPRRARGEEKRAWWPGLPALVGAAKPISFPTRVPSLAPFFCCVFVGFSFVSPVRAGSFRKKYMRARPCELAGWDVWGGRGWVRCLVGFGNLVGLVLHTRKVIKSMIIGCKNLILTKL